jgi:hypothetical protein
MSLAQPEKSQSSHWGDFGMTGIMRAITEIEYRRHTLCLQQQDVQWTARIVSNGVDMPSLLPEQEIVRSWDWGEAVRRAKSRLDAIIDGQQQRVAI